MKQHKNYLLTIGVFLLISGTLASCIKVSNSFTKLPPGEWRGVLSLGEGSVKSSDMEAAFDEKSGAELPFNFEVVYDNPDSFHLVLKHGVERIIVDDINFALDRRIGKDTLRFNFPVFDSHIEAKYEEDAIEGYFVSRSRDNYRIPFRANYGINYRFSQLRQEPVMDLSGRWKVTFGIEGDTPEPAIGIFEQDGNYLTGTFMTETGDYRYLQGTIQKDRMFLSTFDGAHLFLFEAKVQADQSLSGIFRSGSHYKTYWNAEKDDAVQLTSAYDLTYLNEGFDKFDFSMEGLDGKMVSLSNPEFQGKAKLIQIFGTWCPNCYDETRFLVEYLEKNKHPDLVVLGLGFERQKDPVKAKQILRTYKDKMSIPYDLLYAGPSDKDEASKILPMINRVISYPTLIFIDKNDQVYKIHTGFTGPATPGYETFIEEFEMDIKTILGE